jgi:DNA-binding NarL/FixJ family response regulator
MIRVLLADDHRLVREGLRRLLRDAADVEVVGEAASGDEAIDLTGRLAPDVLLLDVTMPGPGVLGVIRAVADAGTRSRVLVLSAHRESEYAVRAIRAGAAGYLVKDRTAQELLEAVRRVASGRRYLTPAVADLLAEDAVRPAPPQPEDLLSTRERQVLELLAAGKSNKEVAGALGLSPKTISTYRARLLEKLHLQSNADLVRFALRRHLGPDAM